MSNGNIPVVNSGPIMNAFRQTFLFLTKLAWDSRVTLPIIITGAFMVMDIRMQVEINVHTERMLFQGDEDEIVDDNLNDSDSWTTDSDFDDVDDDDDDDDEDDHGYEEGNPL
ncbi:hypothetical protein HA402_013076 [Bradysia odoriphaga]|nr:hypothetical protein HA402_013076 [Bradysia odoriphaga]